MNKKEKIKEIESFISKLRKQDINDLNPRIEGAVGDILKYFAVVCKKCGSSKIFVSWEDGCDYGGYTGYAPGQKLFKCLDCGNAASFRE